MPSSFPVASPKPLVASPKAASVASSSTTRLPTASDRTSNWRMFCCKRVEMAKKVPTAIIKKLSKPTNMTRECSTLRRLISSTLTITLRISSLMLAATSAERVDTSAELSTTPVRSSSCLETSLPSKACACKASIPSAMSSPWMAADGSAKTAPASAVFAFSCSCAMGRVLIGIYGSSNDLAGHSHRRFARVNAQSSA